MTNSVELETFRSEAGAWLEQNFPSVLAADANVHLRSLSEGIQPVGNLALWKQRMGAKGWGTPTWPNAYGGGGLTIQQAGVLRQEMGRVGAFNPLLAGMGVTMIGPTILDHGTEEQKQQHLPRIVRGEVRWCVGYSEPNAGSDLASLQMRCIDADDHWLINGQKTWTSGAQWSDWCGALVRTDSAAKKQEGISFLLIDMHQPGVETRPIALISGASPFCETFFTNARAEKDAVLGPLNGGWAVGKRLLQHERASQTSATRSGQPPRLDQMAKKYVGVDDKGRIADLDLRARIARHLMDARAHDLTLKRASDESRDNGVTTTASVLKNSATNIAQDAAELMLEIMGGQGLGWSGDVFQSDELQAVRSWLFGKAASIYGGSQEIQNNIISKRILGLPDPTQVQS
jgi:alkylation response protein AidB-like acyl-CoA dehydrogenase